MTRQGLWPGGDSLSPPVREAVSKLRCLRHADIGQHHIFDGSGPDIELRETRRGPARHAVGLEKVNLAGGERRAWQELQQPRLDLGHRKRHRMILRLTILTIF